MTFLQELVLFSCWIMSDSLQHHGMQHARVPCPSLSPRVCSNPCPLSQRCYLTISSCLLLFPSIFPSIRISPNKLALRIRWPKYWSFSFRISPSNEYSRLISFRIGLISLQFKGLSRVFLTTLWKHQFSSAQSSLWSNSDIHTWLLEKP